VNEINVRPTTSNIWPNLYNSWPLDVYLFLFVFTHTFLRIIPFFPIGFLFAFPFLILCLVVCPAIEAGVHTSKPTHTIVQVARSPRTYRYSFFCFMSRSNYLSPYKAYWPRLFRIPMPTYPNSTSIRMQYCALIAQQWKPREVCRSIMRTLAAAPRARIVRFLYICLQSCIYDDVIICVSHQQSQINYYLCS